MGRSAAKERVRSRLRKNDTVEVISGRDSGKRGRVLQVIPAGNRVLVQGVSFVKKHTKPNPQKNIKGGVLEREAPLSASKLMIICAECGKRTRIGSKQLADGRKARACRRCKGVLDK
jgi:large subunit ribosomal protein L24